MIVNGIIVGTRKAATTWLYENYKLNKQINVSTTVKESGFFSGESKYTWGEYQKLYNRSADNESIFNIEVDSSICYSDQSAEMINKYAKDAKILLIMRNPLEYLQSRYTHSKRKGEISEAGVENAYKNNKWLQEELNYKKIIERVKGFGQSSNIKIIKYEQLISDPYREYAMIINHLTNSKVKKNLPDILEKINISRVTRYPLVSEILARSAGWARKNKMNSLVNLVKGTGILNYIEQTREQDAGGNELNKSWLNTELAEQVEIWENL